MKVQKLNQRHARWSLYLSRFDFALKHVTGKSMERVVLWQPLDTRSNNNTSGTALS